MARQLENRSLDRGITVLECLAEGGAMSLHKLHLATGLPKSTLRRLLATLVARGIVRVGLGDKRYRTNVALPDINPIDLPPRAARLVEMAMPHMIELTRKVGWPSDLHLFDEDRMRVVELTRTLSPFHIHRGAIDIGVNVFATAGGRAYLSALDATRVEAIIQSIGQDNELGLDRFAIRTDTLMTDLEEIRAKGYASRLPNYQGETSKDDQLRVIAVPLLRDQDSIGALTLIWPRAYLPHDEFAASYLDDLWATSRQISESLSQNN